MWPRNTLGYRIFRDACGYVAGAALIAWGIVEGVSWLLGKL
jgi:hypothetical protein